MSHLAEEIAEAIADRMLFYNLLNDIVTKLLDDDNIDVSLFRNESGRLGVEVAIKGFEETVIIIPPSIEGSASDVLEILPKP